MLKRRHLKPTTDKYNRKHVINYVGDYCKDVTPEKIAANSSRVSPSA